MMFLCKPLLSLPVLNLHVHVHLVSTLQHLEHLVHVDLNRFNSVCTCVCQCPRYLIVDGNGGWDLAVPTRQMRWAASTELRAAT